MYIRECVDFVHLIGKLIQRVPRPSLHSSKHCSIGVPLRSVKQINSV